MLIMRNVWKLISRFGTVIILLAGLFQIYEIISTPRAILVAEVEHSDFVLPPTLKAEIDGIIQAHNPVEILGVLKEIEILKGDPMLLADVLNGVTEYLSKERPRYLSSNLFLIESLWSIDLLNRGRQKCSNVSVTLPRSGIALIQRDGQAPKVLTEAKIVPVGDMLPQDKVLILAWTGIFSGSHYARDIRVSHDSGLGRVSTRTSVGPFWGWMERYWLVVLSVILLAVCNPAVIMKLMKR